MKIRQSILWLCGAAVVVLALVIWFPKRPATESPVLPQSSGEAPGETAEHKPAVAPGARETVAPLSSPGTVSPAVVPGATATVPPQSKAAQARQSLSTLNDVPIDFYGKLQDQFSSPVAGAAIIGSIIYDNGSSNGVREVKTVSDSNGLFELHGGNGESLSVTPHKEGYALAAGEGGFKYSNFYPEVRHIPDPLRPTIIEMWKLQGAEMLTHFEISTYVSLDGTPYRFDLHTSKRTQSGGDIVVRIGSVATPNVMEKYDWKASIQALDGGVIPCSGVGFEKMFFAPESGYESEFVVNYEKNSQPWSSRFNGGFYFKSRNGATYGKLGIAITTDVVKKGVVPITISGYLNPAGSRNLEVNPAFVKEAAP
jgi:hypothetical protein